MAEKFYSLRRKLVVKLGVTFLVSLLFVFALIIVKNTLDFQDSITETESRYKAALINKGKLLVKNNSIALVGMVDDNAFSAVEEIVTQTVQGDDDIVYGIFSDMDSNYWVYSFKNQELQLYKPLVDAKQQWALNQKQVSHDSLYFDHTEIIEFSAPVLFGEEQLGVIRYGMSTVALVNALLEATEKSTENLIQTLMGLLAVSLLSLAATYWRTDSVARRITIPLNLLTDAANVVASGHYDQKIEVRTNDEIGILAKNFNKMTQTINHTIADLAEINHIGTQLAKLRETKPAFDCVLQGMLKQLMLPFGALFCYEASSQGFLACVSQLQDDSAITPDCQNRFASLLASEESRHQLDSAQAVDWVKFTVSTKQDQNWLLLCGYFGLHEGKALYLLLATNDLNHEVQKSEREFCQSISQLLATSLQNISMNALLEEQNRTLEDKVASRTQELNKQNLALSSTLKELEQAQAQLVEAEKMASLGSLVAGISHEVNTPLGVSVTAASHLSEQTRIFEKNFNEGALTKSGFVSYLQGAGEASKIILSNLDRAATLIQSFKQIAVDQTSDVKTDFNVKQHLDMLIMSLRPSIKHLSITISLEGDEHIDIVSFPGLLNQIVTNLVMNSIKHGLVDRDNGEVRVTIDYQDEQLGIVVEDNGVGIPDQNKTKVFDPFFTTRRGTGGSGLGLNIVYNLVTQKLGGEIRLEDNQPNGARFIVTFPAERKMSGHAIS